MPSQTPSAEFAVNNLLFTPPSSLDRCIVLSDLSNVETPTANNDSPCTLRSIDSVTPLSEDSSCVSAASSDKTDAQETPLSVRSGRKRKHQRRRTQRSTLPQSPLVDTVQHADGSSTPAKECSGIKVEPKMPKLLPEPCVRYNPETPLRISIHLPLNGVINTSKDGLLKDQSSPVHCSMDDPDVYDTGLADGAAMPVDLTSRASVLTQPTSSVSSAAAAVVGSVSSSVLSIGPVYSPISSMSGRSTPDAEKDDVGGFRREIPQPSSMEMMASFLNRFTGIPAESLQFSPSHSFWTRSFAEQLADFNRNSFVAGQTPPAPLLSPVTAQHSTEVNCQRNNHPNLTSMSAVNDQPNSCTRQNTESRDCMAVRPTIVVDGGLSGVFDTDLSNDNRHGSHNVNTNLPTLSSVESRLSAETVNLDDILGSRTSMINGMIYRIYYILTNVNRVPV